MSDEMKSDKKPAIVKPDKPVDVAAYRRELRRLEREDEEREERLNSFLIGAFKLLVPPFLVALIVGASLFILWVIQGIALHLGL